MSKQNQVQVDREIPSVNATKKMPLVLKVLAGFGFVVFIAVSTVSYVMQGNGSSKPGGQKRQQSDPNYVPDDMFTSSKSGTPPPASESSNPLASPSSAARPPQSSSGAPPLNGFKVGPLEPSAQPDAAAGHDPIKLEERRTAEREKKERAEKAEQDKKSEAENIRERKLKPWSGEAAPAQAAPMLNAPPPGGGGPTLSGGENAAVGEEGRQQGGSLSGLLSAVPMRDSTRIDPSRTIPEAATIECVNEFAIQNLLAGKIRCVISRAVYSADGKHVLIPPGSVASGEYRATSKVGDRRLGVIWQRIRRQDGAIVAIQSPGAAPDGTAGLTGDVDGRFWERFGGALLVSLVDDAVTVAGAYGRQLPQNSTSAARDMIAQSLESSINLPPVITIPKGRPISIIVNEDVLIRGGHS
jgi:type IV secretion system protein VirB10